MTGMMDKFRLLSKALSVNDEDKDTDHANGNSSYKPTGGLSFLSKLGVSNTNHHPEKKHKTVLVVDSRENDWMKAFRGKTLHNSSYDLRVEQASFSELDIVSSSEKGVTVSMKVIRSGTVVARSFRPDFVLVREYVRGVDSKSDCRNLLFGLMHGNVPALNSLYSVYNFLEKPIMYSQLLQIEKRLGKEIFPLVDQIYYQSYREMLLPPSLPVVVKVGSTNSGFGKVCVASPRGFQDVASLVAVTGTYATTEPFLEGKFDIRIQKIGYNYRVYKRKSLSDSWKTNTGTSVVEEIALTERYKLWADECSKLFGGLDILCVEAIHTKDNKEYIVEVNDMAMTLCNEKREEDMRLISELVIKKMENLYQPQAPASVNAVPKGAITDGTGLSGSPYKTMKTNPQGPKRPSTCDPSVERPAPDVPPSPAAVRRATSHENINGTVNPKTTAMNHSAHPTKPTGNGTPGNARKTSDKSGDKPSSRRGSFSGRLFNVLSDKN